MTKPVQASIVLVALCICVAATSPAQDGEKRSSEDKRDRKAASKVVEARRPTLVKLTTDQEDRALNFAREHHPDLGELLEQLRKSSRTGFSRGIREVHAAAQRLERMREKQPARFETELQNWKTYSNIRLLTARWVMSQDPALEKQIRGLLRKRQEARLESLQAERDRLAKKLKELNSEISKSTADLDQDLETEWDRLTKQVKNAARTQRRTSDRPASKSKARTTDKNKPERKKTQE